MDERKRSVEQESDFQEAITPWFIITLLKPIMREEFIAERRNDRTGIRMKFLNGQKFHLTIEEIK